MAQPLETGHAGEPHLTSIHAIGTPINTRHDERRLRAHQKNRERNAQLFGQNEHPVILPGNQIVLLQESQKVDLFDPIGQALANLAVNLSKLPAEQNETQDNAPQFPTIENTKPKIGRLQGLTDWVVKYPGRVAAALATTAVGTGVIHEVFNPHTVQAAIVRSADQDNRPNRPSLILPSAENGNANGPVTTAGLPQGAIKLSNNAWYGKAPENFQASIDRLIEINNGRGINYQASLGLLKGQKDMAVYIKADDGSYLPVQIYERGVLHWYMVDGIFDVVRKSTESDLLFGLITIKDGNSLVSTFSAEANTARSTTPVVGEPGSLSPTIVDLLTISTHDGNQSKAETLKIGQKLSMVVEKGGRVREMQPTDNIPEPLKNITFSDYVAGHNMPQEVMNFLQENFGSRWIPEEGMPLTPYFLTKAKVDNIDTWVAVGIHERAAFTMRIVNGKVLVEGGLSGNQTLAILNNGNTELPSVPEPVKPGEFPKEIGNLATDHVVIHNKGTKIGVIDNRQDPQNNWQAISEVAKKFAPDDKFEYFFYENPDDVPSLPAGTKTTYDPVVNWGGAYLGATPGKQARIKTGDGTWQYHLSLPRVSQSDINRLNRDITMSVLLFIIQKDDIFKTWGKDVGAILGQQVTEPYNSGKYNFAFNVIEK